MKYLPNLTPRFKQHLNNEVDKDLIEWLRLYTRNIEEAEQIKKYIWGLINDRREI